MKVVVTGGSGMLGSYVIEMLTREEVDVVLLDRADLDLNNPASVYDTITNVKPEAILHLAAETDVDLCERDPRLAAVKNHLSTFAMARAAKEVGAWLSYVSTSAIYGGEGKMSYNEMDETGPVNYYAKSKLQGESSILSLCTENSLIIRSGWMIGGGQIKDHKFVGKIMKQIRDGADEIKAVSDKYGSVTYARDLASFIVKSMLSKRIGVINFASEGVVSRYDIARYLCEKIGFEGGVIPVQSSMFPMSAPRPVSDAIYSVYLEKESYPKNWMITIDDYLSEFELV